MNYIQNGNCSPSDLSQISQCDKSVLLTSTLSNSHSMTRQFQHSMNVECGKIMRNSTAFEIRIRTSSHPYHLVAFFVQNANSSFCALAIKYDGADTLPSLLKNFWMRHWNCAHILCIAPPHTKKPVTILSLSVRRRADVGVRLSNRIHFLSHILPFRSSILKRGMRRTIARASAAAGSGVGSGRRR